MREPIVITGLGVVSPIGANVPEFLAALRAGESGIGYWPEAAELGLGCQVMGMPKFDDSVLNHLPPPRRRAMSPSMEYAAAAAIECWRDAGLPYDPDLRNAADWDSGIAIRLGIGPIDVLMGTVAPLVAERQHRRMGSRIVERVMVSGAAATVGGILGLGGPVTTVSSACCSGASAVHQGLQQLRLGRCRRMLVGGVEIGCLRIADVRFDAGAVPRLQP